MKSVTYTFEMDKAKVNINFVVDNARGDSRPITFCMISVQNANGKIENYCSGTICNPHDKYCYRTGLFIAFKKASVS